MDILTEKTIRDKIKRLQNTGESLNSIASRSGVPQSSLSRFLNGKTITLPSFLKLWPIITEQPQEKAHEQQR